MRHLFSLAQFLWLLAGSVPAAANGFHIDAFGLAPSAQMTRDRVLWSGAKIVDGADQFVSPGATQEVVIFLGHKSIIAGRKEGQVALIAMDRNGNMVADGTEAQFTFDKIEDQTAPTKHGIAAVFFKAQEKADMHFAGGTVEGIQSQRASFRIVAETDSLRSTLLIPPGELRPERLIHIKSTPLRDQFFNTAPVGLGAAMVIDHDDGSVSFLSADVIDGRGYATLLSRDIDDRGIVRMLAGSSVSAPLELELTPFRQVEETMIRIWSEPHTGALAMQIGPFMTDAGYLLTDGAPISVRVKSGSGRHLETEGWLSDGFFEAVLPIDAADGPFDVRFTTTFGEETRILMPGTAISGGGRGP